MSDNETEPRSKKSQFDKIMDEIGYGKFQNNFNGVIICLSFFLSMQFISKIITVTVPDHWCHVPGREATNYTLEEWKNVTIPRVYQNGINSYSKCTRFSNQAKNETVKCDQGWEYDHTWYDMTASMQNNWVCDKSMIPIHVLAVNRVASIIGTVICGQLADNYGRKPMLFVALALVLIGRTALIFTSQWVYVFMFFSFLGYLTHYTLVLCSYILAVEISGTSKRAFITMITGYGWGIGSTISPLIMWWQRDWTEYCLIVTVPCAIFLFYPKWMTESPRWLASSGKTQRAIKILEKMAKTNKTKIPENAEKELVEDMNKNNNKFHSVFGIFTSARLAKNFIILAYSSSVLSIIYVCLILGAINLGGNPYLNYAFLGAVDLPVYVISKYGCDRFGRRVVVLFGLIITVIGCLTMFYIVQDPSIYYNHTHIMSIIFILTKGSVALTLKALFLQIMEICPTCIRQTSTSLISILSGTLGILGPYIVALGTTVNIIIPYLIYASALLLALIGCIFLPETLNQQLPDTLEDAATFGADQNIWGRPETPIYQNIPLKEMPTTDNS